MTEMTDEQKEILYFQWSTLMFFRGIKPVIEGAKTLFNSIGVVNELRDTLNKDEDKAISQRMGNPSIWRQYEEYEKGKIDSV